MQEQMSDLVTDRIPGKLISWVAQQEKTSARSNATRPGFQVPRLLEFLPILRMIKEIDVRLMLGRGGVLSSLVAMTRKLNSASTAARLATKLRT